MEPTLVDHFITFVLTLTCMSRKRFTSILIIALIITAFIVLTPSENYTNCYNNSYFMNTEFSGSIVRKFIDKSQHSTPTVEIKDTTSDSVKSISFFGDYSGLYYKVEVGDTVTKKIESLDIHFRKANGGLILIGTANFKCDQAQFHKEEKRFGFFYRLFR